MAETVVRARRPAAVGLRRASLLLEELARYAGAAHAQDEALAAGDLEGFHEHAGEADRVQARIDALGGAAALAGDPFLTREATALLGAARAANARVADRLAQLRGAVALEREEERIRERRLGGYGTPAHENARFDVTL